MPTDQLLASLARVEWIASSPLCTIANRYILRLRACHYSEHTIRTYLIACAHFSYWVTGLDLDLDHINAELVTRYLQQHLPVCNCPPPRKTAIADSRAALRQLIPLIPQPSYGAEKVVTTPIQRELIAYHHYLAGNCGLAANTCHQRERLICCFLESYYDANQTLVRLPNRHELLHFVAEWAQHWTPSSLNVVKGSLRSYLRFRALSGDQTQSLAASLPRIANWTRATLPKAMTEPQLHAFLGAFDRNNPVGKRDYAIARCLADLGLRGQEVCHLQLEALDWRNSTLEIAYGKGRRTHRLPLPTLTGEAIADYLSHGRPTVSLRTVFVRHRAPLGIPLSVPAIRSAMGRAFARCGLSDLFCSTHVLRHTTAVRLQKSGASLKEIADLLGHKNLDTTSRYARVDLEGLRSVAMPWPEVLS